MQTMRVRRIDISVSLLSTRHFPIFMSPSIFDYSPVQDEVVTVGSLMCAARRMSMDANGNLVRTEATLKIE